MQDDYEMAENSKNTTSKDACRHWRLARALKKKGAFEGLKVLTWSIHATEVCAPPLKL